MTHSCLHLGADFSPVAKNEDAEGNEAGSKVGDAHQGLHRVGSTVSAKAPTGMVWTLQLPTRSLGHWFPRPQKLLIIPTYAKTTLYILKPSMF